MPYAELPFSHQTALTYQEEVIAVGKGWRLSAYFENVSASGYCAICFHTPKDKKTLYAFADIGKTGGPIRTWLNEGGSPVGGISISPWNLNRNYKAFPCLLTNILAVTSISGGIDYPSRYVGGEAQGNNTPGGSAVGGFIYLDDDTNYAVKVSSLVSSTDINIVFDVGVDT